MKKTIIIILLSLFAVWTQGQTTGIYQIRPGYGWSETRIKVLNTFTAPTIPDTVTAPYGVSTWGSLATYAADTSLRMWTGVKWQKIEKEKNLAYLPLGYRSTNPAFTTSDDSIPTQHAVSAFVANNQVHLGNHNLTLSTNRLVVGDGHTLGFAGLPEFSVSADSIKLKTTSIDFYSFINSENREVRFSTSGLDTNQEYSYPSKSGLVDIIDMNSPSLSDVTDDFTITATGTCDMGYIDITNANVSISDFTATVEYAQPYGINSFPVISTSNSAGYGKAEIVSANASQFVFKLTDCVIRSTIRVYYQVKGY